MHILFRAMGKGFGYLLNIVVEKSQITQEQRSAILQAQVEVPTIPVPQSDAASIRTHLWLAVGRDRSAHHR